MTMEITWWLSPYKVWGGDLQMPFGLPAHWPQDQRTLLQQAPVEGKGTGNQTYPVIGTPYQAYPKMRIANQAYSIMKTAYMGIDIMADTSSVGIQAPNSAVPEHSGTGLGPLILVPNCRTLVWHWHFCSFRYRTDWMPESLTVWHYSI